MSVSIAEFSLLASPNCFSENVRVFAVIITELKLSNVERHIFLADLVECANNTALHDGPEALNRVGMDSTDNILMFGMTDDGMGEGLSQMPIAGMVVGAKQADLMRDSLIDEAIQYGRGGVLNDASHYIALAPDGANDGRLAGAYAASTAPAFIPMLVIPFAAHESFIDFDNSAQFIHIILDKGAADAVAHIPSCLVGAEAHYPHDLEGRNAFLASQHHVSNAVPVPQRLVCVLEDSSGDMGEAVAVRGTFLTLPMMAGSKSVDFGVSTARASDTVGPAPNGKILPAGFFIGEHSLKLGDGHLMDWFGASHRHSPVGIGEYRHV